MVATEISIRQLQNYLNVLMGTKDAYIDNYQEIYQLSQQLDELIVQYYRDL